MSILISPDSVEGKELARWNRPKNVLDADGRPGMNRVGYEEYPKCLYKAGRPSMGNVAITGSMTVHNEEQERLAVGQGWSRTQEAAIQLVHDTHVEHAKLAANRAYHDRQMSEPAQREAEQREAEIETVQHVPSLPEKPRRGRPRKTDVQ